MLALFLRRVVSSCIDLSSFSNLLSVAAEPPTLCLKVEESLEFYFVKYLRVYNVKIKKVK